MPKKSERRVPLPEGLVPLLTQRQLETYYDVSHWQIQQWLDEGMPEEPFTGRGRRFNLAKVQDWQAERSELLAATV